MTFPSLALWRHRPRALTLLVVLAVVALIALANLTFERFVDVSANIAAKSYGWPFIWHRYVFLPWDGVTVGWYYSVARLIGDLSVWLILAAASGGACEWFLRRYRPKPRWSLRTMLVVVGICGAFFAWIAAARHQADFQDSLIAEIGSGVVRVERRGPKWLDWIGADRFRRQIIRAEIYLHADTESEANEKLERLRPALERLPRLRYLEIWVERNHLPSRMADALTRIPKLRALSIALNLTPISENDRRVWQECLVAIGKMKELEHLHLYRMKVPSRSLARLAGLTNLKRLILSEVIIEEEGDDTPVLAHLPPLRRLESLVLEHSQIRDRDLRYITALSGLRSLGLGTGAITDEGLRKLARLPLLEELAINVDNVSPAGLHSLAALTRLRTLHVDRGVVVGDKTLALDHDDTLYVPESELDGFRRALKGLRHSRPGLVIDGQSIVTGSRLGPEADMIYFAYDAFLNRQQPFSLPSGDGPWMTPAEKATFEARGGWARFDAAGSNGATVSF